MDFANVITIISNIGFPIACCLIMIKLLDKKDTQHTEEMNKMADAVNNNTIALNKLIAKLGKEVDND